MKMLSYTLMALTLCCFFVSCGSKSTRKTVKHPGHETAWDYSKIEQNKAIEKASQPSQEERKKWREEESNCTIMNASQMKRSRASGCQKLDPRDGFGDNAYCCEN